MTAARPRVSVIIPAYRSAATIEACLKGLERQSFRDFETIVVESSQDEETAEIVARFPGVIFEQSPQRLFPHAARNRGVELAGGSLLVFTDPDTRARPDWLEQLVAAADAGHELVVGANAVSEQTWSERGVHLCKYSPVLAGLPPGPRWVASTSKCPLHARAFRPSWPLRRLHLRRRRAPQLARGACRPAAVVRARCRCRASASPNARQSLAGAAHPEPGVRGDADRIRALVAASRGGVRCRAAAARPRGSRPHRPHGCGLRLGSDVRRDPAAPACRPGRVVPGRGARPLSTAHRANTGV